MLPTGDPLTAKYTHGLKVKSEGMEKVRNFIFLGSKILQMVTAALKLKDACSLEEKL